MLLGLKSTKTFRELLNNINSIMKSFQEYTQSGSNLIFSREPLVEEKDIEKLIKGYKPEVGGKSVKTYLIRYERPSQVASDFEKIKKVLDKEGIGYSMDTSKSSKGTIVIPDDKITHKIYFKPSKTASKGPSGAEWESIIAIGVNKIKGKAWDTGREWEVGGKFWEEYGDIGIKIGKDFISQIGVDKLEGTGQSSASLNPKWRGTNKTPKTDIKSSKHNISLKKAGGSQLMSGSKDEVISTVEAAQETFGASNQKAVQNLVSIMERKLVKLSETDAVSSIDKLRDKEKLSDKEMEQIAELDSARIGAKEIEQEFNKVFASQEFLGHFCFEAATGNIKFKDSWPSATVVCTFNPDKATLSDVLFLDSPENAGVKLASGNQFYVSFKSTAGSAPYLAMRSKKKSKKAMAQAMSEDTIPSLKTILLEEIAKEPTLLSEDYQQLDEFQILNTLKQQLTSFGNNAKRTVMNVWKNIMDRIKKALAMIARLGKKALGSLRRFFGLDIAGVKLTRTGGAYPVDSLIFNK